MRHGFQRQAGWIFLCILSILRIVGGITHVMYEHDTSNSNLEITYEICEASGVSPLLLATLGFLRTICQSTLESHLVTRALQIMGILGTVALILSIVGGVQESSAKTESALTSAASTRHIGAILFVVLFALIVLLHVLCWANKSRIAPYRRMLLKGISCALPFVCVRVLYSILASYAPLPETINADGSVSYAPSNSPLERFSYYNGSWIIYLVMSVLMEFITVVIYITVGLKTPLQREPVDTMPPQTWSQGYDDSNVMLNPRV
ncbi:hypothetical protein WOLCODRAFT_135033 [Wolfiporia cocos MD-104 SS10]|uniref:DUF7702 domain-containing protein n=1 Tax=Wolfiporia cocos (strain MD-104) TaxID=742152 RepID=A0A2H3ITI1_WOLCO|nr:hypothetical protein WOLCODRAFT_135033 [Wolfiporia cocos MD-104 SS10]